MRLFYHQGADFEEQRRLTNQAERREGRESKRRWRREDKDIGIGEALSRTSARALGYAAKEVIRGRERGDRMAGEMLATQGERPDVRVVWMTKIVNNGYSCRRMLEAEMNISLTPELEREVARRVESGRYGSASEVVRDALRLLLEDDELKELRREQLQLQIQKGVADLDAGRSQPFDEALLDQVKAEGRRRRKESL